MPSFRDRSYYCYDCDTGYNNNKDKHICKSGSNVICKLCDKIKHHEDIQKEKIYCEKCNRYCINKECLEEHNKKICKNEYKCVKCKNIVYRKKDNDHDSYCGLRKCFNCGKKYINLTEHQCYVQKKVQQDSGTHIPNLVIAHDFHGNKIEFSNDNVRSANENFCRWALNKRRKGTTYIAHNAKAYDTYFIIQFILKYMSHLKFNIIQKGTKIIFLEIKHGLNVKFIDSFNFVQSTLADFPKTFNIEGLKKDIFHTFSIHQKIKHIKILYQMCTTMDLII